MKHKAYELIVNAVSSKKLDEPFSSQDFRAACPGLADNTYNVFLNKHRRGNPSKTSELFERVAQNSFELIRPFKYGFK